MKEKRILSIDFGEKRIGIAVTDPLNIFAYPLTTLKNDTTFYEKLEIILKEYSVVKIIIGNPIKESGKISKLDEQIKIVQSEIVRRFSISTELVDERYSSDIAKQRIIESVSSKKKRRDKKLIDMNAAAVILEDYLKHHSIVHNNTN